MNSKAHIVMVLFIGIGLIEPYSDSAAAPAPFPAGSAPYGPECRSELDHATCSIIPSKNIVYKLSADYNWKNGWVNEKGEHPSASLRIYAARASDPENSAHFVDCAKWTNVTWDNNDHKYTLRCDMQLKRGRAYIVKAIQTNRQTDSNYVTLTMAW